MTIIMCQVVRTHLQGSNAAVLYCFSLAKREAANIVVTGPARLTHSTRISCLKIWIRVTHASLNVLNTVTHSAIF